MERRQGIDEGGGLRRLIGRAILNMSFFITPSNSINPHSVKDHTLFPKCRIRAFRYFMRFSISSKYFLSILSRIIELSFLSTSISSLKES